MAVWIERPRDPILGQPMREHRTAVIEDDRVRLALGRPQHTTNHLPEQPHLARRAREDAAADLRHVPAFGQNHAVGNELGLAAL